MRIKVTQDHIDNGIGDSGCYCPIALAISEKLGFQVYVGNTRIDKVIYQEDKGYNEYKALLSHSKVSAEFLEDFDNPKKKVKPHKFILKELS